MPDLMSRLFGRSRPAPEDRWSRVIVVFTRAEREVAKLDIRTGPCVAAPGRSRPMVGVTNQDPGRPEALQALYVILTGRPAAGAWQSIQIVGPGRLARLSDVFTAGMAALNRENLARQQERPEDHDWILEPDERVAARWQAAMSPDAGPGRSALIGYCAWARVAQERGQAMYCWSGPGFNPRTLVSGTMEQLPAYLEAKRKRR
jgi:hypothetical protein